MIENNTRTFADLMYKATKLFAPFLPSVYRIGDFGRINPRDGEFYRSGNLFERYPTLIDVIGPLEEVSEGERIFQASQATGGWTSIDMSDMCEFAHAKVKVGWEFKEGAFAALVPTDPVFRSIRYLGKLAMFLQDIKSNNPNHKFISFLQDKVLVTSLLQCTSYAQFFTDGREGSTCIAFHDGTGPDGKLGWMMKGVSGQSAFGKYSPETWLYTPMAGLRDMEDILNMGCCAISKKLLCECGDACEGSAVVVPAATTTVGLEDEDEMEEDDGIESIRFVPTLWSWNEEDGTDVGEENDSHRLYVMVEEDTTTAEDSRADDEMKEDKDR